ncbi:cell division protein FtsB [Psychromonas sp. RZ22]|uniref:cell division protein FtsB n=1 Tax=Psychromonas algarum TaxID=2555643 RepID=UPI00106897F9|nr:cell division protein FtsB [Psychromonas sp. RZ22]TEW53467.1 cell division protein FtsB [Psychromonas sp. RZ22]
MRLLLFIFIFLFAVLQYHLWFGKNGLQDNRALVEEVNIAVAGNAELVNRNQMMFSEIDDLKTGTNAIEERARNELGLIKEGETFFRIIPKDER